MIEYNKLIFEISKDGRKSYSLPECDVPNTNIEELIPAEFLRKEDAQLPQVSEVDVIRHFTLLSNKNFGVDTGFYPLGSCTMKYNPKINEDMASLDGFTKLHPLQPESTVQGALELMYNLQESLQEITGMSKVSLQPAAGAQGELTGLMIVKAYHDYNGNHNKKKIIIPDSAHGTNPASTSMAGFTSVEIKSNDKGIVDIQALKEVLDEDVAGLMLTNPNTLGLFEKDILTISELVHEVGGLLYYDGANMNANMGITRPGDMGFDIVHLNLHKTFSAPHGGGGPGSGPVGVVKELAPFLPMPIVEKEGDEYTLKNSIETSIGAVKNFYGNFGVLVKAYTYILTMGGEGLRQASRLAVLNANYMKERLKDDYILPVDEVCKHEFVLGGLGENEGQVTTLDVAKRLMDYGYHPPTIYFPLIIDSAMMIEPTETESKENMDGFIDALIKIKEESISNPEKLKKAPFKTCIRRFDEVTAARKPILRYTK
ncbi:aminomethyl-transferring glycine dehydrogenase subunit GcvPB [Vallitalea sp.]|jgi:glycine dehydrogenase subunit 2|uniref:aminomethyl-transferring glycine dehydrogenase subunit GcvPB n=1 Tax=Vallitalea sp. TaxID=1882829 RepID=UPI0025E1C993|nr:aminomethyl-transferring glycine dehydrogenase subunit GcvPB [Vallitalea sp.]MCT4688134.1 aminomethyl-transferring glycine dehydrogenase subunit GcvPB [Vallitalea sp.]